MIEESKLNMGEESKLNEVMEAETIEKNGLKTKNKMGKGNRFKMQKMFVLVSFVLLILSVGTVSCKKDKPPKDDPTTNEDPNGNGGENGGGSEKGTYLGIIGFASDINTEKINLLTVDTKNKYKNFIDNLQMSDATKLYYSVKLGLETLIKAQYPPDLENVSIITFTDGLDQGSNDQRGDLSITNNQWLNEINELLKRQISNTEIKAYSIGIKDAISLQEEAQFRVNIKSIASLNCDYVVNDMEEVNQRFTEIANSLYKVNTSQNIELKINSKQLGTIQCFTFDGKDNNTSQLYIKGTLYASGQELGLKDIEYSQGFGSSSGNNVISVQKDGKRIFTFKDLKRSNGEMVPTDNIKEFYTLADDSWTENPEFRNEGGINASVTQKSAMIMLVLDCSSSLKASGFAKMKTAAKNFIDILAGGSSGNGTPPNPPTGLTAVQEGTSIKLSWNSVSGATSYNIYRSSSASGTYTSYGNLSATSGYDNNPFNGANYYKVSAVNTAGESVQSGYAYCNFNGGSSGAMAQVRFKREKAYTNFTIMGLINNAGDSMLAGYDFGTNSGVFVSPYYDIPAGNHRPFFSDGSTIYTFNAPLDVYTFQAGYKYTFIIGDNGSNLTGQITNDGQKSNKSNNTIKSQIEVLRIPKGNIECRSVKAIY